jgi:signal transduction histidine kinase
VLQAISDELVIAIQNALSVQEVKDLNATLQQRINDATAELRRSNAQLQRLDEAKDEFISMASHQLRTPLTSIKGYISMLVEGDVGKVTNQQKHLLDEAFISSERMVRLIGDFLNVSRLQTGKFIIEKGPVDLAKVVGQEIDSLLPNATARGLKFSYKPPKNLPLLNLDDSKIRQVIMNFADNAIYYSKEKSTIKIDLKLEGRWIEFTVKDTGIGVPESEKEHLFTKFFRATNARKQRPDGTGVGLFLAKKVVDAHDGQIIFESKQGKGSTFGFRLPLASSRVAGNAKQLDDKPDDHKDDASSN